MNVLIIQPHQIKAGGGVANYFDTIKKYIKINVEYFEVGARKNRESIICKFINLCRYYRKLKTIFNNSPSKYDIIHLNPSFLHRSLVRDGLLLKLSKNYDNKIIVFFRGWNTNFANIVEKYFLKIFIKFYNHADAFIVLSEEFKIKLRKWGLRQPIFVETTLVDDELLNDFSINDRIKKIDKKDEIIVLFLSRVEKEKGICETIAAIKKFEKSNFKVKLKIAGDGLFLKEAKKYAKAINISDKVEFLGYLTGKEKIKAYIKSDLYVLPTYHGEGLPNSVLEAMAFGLPVITTPVGGIKDFFDNGEYGFFCENKNEYIIASLIERILNDKKLWKKMSSKAHLYAMNRFLASKVAYRLEKIYDEIHRINKKLSFDLVKN